VSIAVYDLKEIWKDLEMPAAILICLALLLLPTSTLAELRKVESQQEFISLINGKTLTRPWIKIQVTPDGRIAGKGARRTVAGTWAWQDGYFCRDLFWGGNALGFNCQEVRSTDDGQRIRFTSDRGTGDSASFRLR